LKKIFQSIFVWQTGAVFYFGFLFYAVFLARRRNDLRWTYWQNTNFIPFKKKWHFFTDNQYFSSAELYAFFSDTAGNIILFIPFSLFFYFLGKVKSKRRIILYAFLTSLGIECIQFLFQIGTADVDDLLLNTAGALVGTVLIRPVIRLQLSP
jgi:glycopeptide antibiotics resistance protein